MRPSVVSTKSMANLYNRLSTTNDMSQRFSRDSLRASLARQFKEPENIESYTDSNSLNIRASQFLFERNKPNTMDEFWRFQNHHAEHHLHHPTRINFTTQSCGNDVSDMMNV